MFYGAVAWDPWIIVAQIVCLQCLYYITLGMFLSIFVGVRVSRMSLIYFFDYSTVTASTVTGWCIIVSFLRSALVGDGFTWRVVMHAARVARDSYYTLPFITADSKKNIIFNAEIDNELLHLMQEQVMQGMRAHRGFKNEAYVAVAKALSSSEKFNGLQFSTTIVVNKCRKLKDSFMAVTELLNAYGFGFDNTTKRVVASGEVWKNWEQSHPKARAWQSRTIDYENMCLVWRKDSAIGQFSQPSSSAYSDMDENSIGGLLASLGDDINLDIDDVMEDFSNGESRGESIKSRSGKRVKDNDELATYFRESTEVLRLVIVDAADAIRNPKNNSDVRTNAVVEALESIEELTAEEVDMAHEWLVARKNMTTTFLSARNKVDWISRRMSSIRNDTMFGS